MGHSNDHSHPASHGHGDHNHDYKSIERKHLLIALAVNFGVMVVEAVGGWLTNSLALMSDAGHMLTHIFALATSYFAILLASRNFSDYRSYGFFRAEILASFINSLFLFGVVVWIGFEAVRHFMAPAPIKVKEMIGIALLGLVTNLISFFLLRGDSERDINIRAAFMHVLTDTFSSVVIILGGLVIYWKGWTRVDPALSLFISLLILVWAWRLLKESTNILLESAPKGLNIASLKEALKHEIPELRDVHDVHVWVITSNLYSATLHVTLDDIPLSQSTDIVARIQRFLHEKYHIEHTSIQIETGDESCLHREGIRACKPPS